MKDDNNIPKHIAIIMDGNGRWAESRGKPRVFGHKNGVQSVRTSVEAAAKLGVKSLTLFAFSSENINRPKLEIEALFSLFFLALKNEIKKLAKHNISLKLIGDLSIFPEKIQKLAKKSTEELSKNTGLELIIALNYGGKWDIVQAVNKLNNAKEVVTEENLSQNLSISQDIDLVIRTSGEKRISNFLLWQCAYSEFYFTDVFWPDFNEFEFDKAISEFQNRKRRFGK
jgi:undecaprenyl diphosphate synthase